MSRLIRAILATAGMVASVSIMFGAMLLASPIHHHSIVSAMVILGLGLGIGVLGILFFGWAFRMAAG